MVPENGLYEGWKVVGQLPVGVAKLQDVLLDLVDHRDERGVVAACGIRQTPISVERSAYVRAAHAAAHRYGDVRGGDRVNRLAVLRAFHVDAVQFLHQSDGVLIDARLRFGSRRIAVEHIARKQFSEHFGDLAAAGIMHADERDLRLTHDLAPASDLFLDFRCLP